MAQTHLAPILESIQLTVDPETWELGFDFSGTVALLQEAYTADHDNGVAFVNALAHYLRGLGEAGAEMLEFLRAEGEFFGSDFSRLLATAGFNIVEGGEGAERLLGTAGDDLLQGHAGNDTIAAGAGNNTILFNKGDGQDVIQADDADGQNTLLFGEGIGLGDIRLEKSGNYDLRITIGEAGDQILLKDWFYGAYETRRIAQFNFTDGTSLTPQGLLEQLPVSTSANSVLNGNEGINDILIAAENSTLYGKGGNDLLYGANKAHLYGGDGDDTLAAQGEENQLWGNAGRDSFLFSSLEDGVSRIGDFTPGEDTLQLDCSIFQSLASGPLTVETFISNASGQAENEQHFLIYNNTSGALLYDADGNGSGAAVHFATLNNKPNLNAGDLLALG